MKKQINNFCSIVTTNFELEPNLTLKFLSGGHLLECQQLEQTLKFRYEVVVIILLNIDRCVMLHTFWTSRKQNQDGNLNYKHDKNGVFTIYFFSN